MNITIRLEQPEDYRAVEELTREAFWGMNHATCDGEHLLVHKLRGMPAFVPELDYVAEVDGQLAGHIIYTRAKVVTPAGKEEGVLIFGPISVLPQFKGRGVGSALLRHTIAQAKAMGERAIVIYGHPGYYPRFGFRPASSWGITSAQGKSFDALMALPLYDGALDGIAGRFIEDEAFQVDPKEVAEFDKTFPPKDPVALTPIEALTDKLPQHIQQALSQRKLKYLSQLQGYSGSELLKWGCLNAEDFTAINHVLDEHGHPQKLLPSSYILQLAAMGVFLPVADKLREKDGISVYRVDSQGEKYVLKVFARAEDRREIANYKLLAALGVATLPLLQHTEYALLLPDVEYSFKYRLGQPGDLADTQVAASIARWYKELHQKGGECISTNRLEFYDETDLITPENLGLVADKTATTDNQLWAAIGEGMDEIRSRIAALPRTLVYNDFYWTNLIVAKDKTSAMMFDYNLLGRGYVYGDIRNVLHSLGEEAKLAFLKEYGEDGISEDEKLADAFLSPLITLITACRREIFPGWAKASLAELKSGQILEPMVRWLDS